LGSLFLLSTLLAKMLSMTAPRPGLAQGVTIDPCTPHGYKRSVEENARHSAIVSAATHAPVSTIVSRGNFSECREAAYSLLQHGHGNECLLRCFFNFFCILLFYTFTSVLSSRCLSLETSNTILREVGYRCMLVSKVRNWKCVHT